MTNLPAIYGPDGAPLALGARLGAGGEGAVFALTSGDAAKIYALPPSKARVEKLEALVRVRNDELARVAAWPSELVSDGRRGVIGFTMPRIEGRQSLAIAMNPGSRKARFPRANWAWLAHVAYNLSAAIETIHRAGVVLGDVNDSNFLVGADTLVRVIDIDSFQVRHYARVLTCDVGVPTYQPPELQGKSYAGLRRSAEHDRFGLAVLIFQLLFMGRHPWAGVREGPELAFDTGEIIAKLPFAFGKDAARAGFRPPPNSVSLDWLTPNVAQNFERAFSGKPLARPTAADWAATLTEFENALAPCASSSVHRYVKANGTCPWCELERRGLFLFVTGEASRGNVVYLDVAEIERRLAEIPKLEAVPVPVIPPTSDEHGEPLPPRLRTHRLAWRGAALASAAGMLEFAARVHHGSNIVWAAALIVAALLYVARPPLGRIRAERHRALVVAQRAFDEVTAEWNRLADVGAFLRARAELQKKLDAYRALPAKYTAERANMESDKARYQERAFLETFLIADAHIAGIGRKRRETLAAYGIESARDVDELLPTAHVPGFGSSKRMILAMWVNAVRSRFKFDPSKPLDQSLRNELQARENRERSDLERELRGGPQALKAAVEQAAARREALRGELELAARTLAKAHADAMVAGAA